MNKIVEGDKCFFLPDGTPLCSIRDLANYLPNLSNEFFTHHVGKEKNDFCNWIRDVFQEKELAMKLSQAKNKEGFQTLLYNHIMKTEMHYSKKKHSPKDQKKQRKRREETPAAAISKTVSAPTATTPPPLATPDNPERRELQQSPERFVQYHEQDSKEKDALADRFDAVTHRFNESLAPETPKAIEDRIDRLQQRHDELKRLISDARREGKDPFIADLTLRTVPSKLRYAAVSHEERDFRSVELLLEMTEKELATAKKKKDVDVREEVMALAGGGS